MLVYRHTLIVGGTGMLEQVSLVLAAQSNHVTFAARRADSFISRHAISHAGAITANYTQTQLFINAVQKECGTHGAVDFALLWIHDVGNESLKALLAMLAESPCRVVHILGSSDSSPRAQSDATEALTKQNGNLTYHSVVLGSKADGQGGRRWLTHQEISDGTLCAITQDANSVIGD